MKEFVIIVLSDDKETTIAIRKSNEDSKPFDQMKIFVQFELNKFFRLVVKQFPEFSFQVEFLKPGRTHNFSGPFAEQGLICMSEAAGFERIDHVSFFLGTMFSLFCGNKSKAPITNAFSMCFDPNVTLSRKLIQRW